MSEVEWSEATEEAPPKKSGPPKWLWIGCGCGCLAAIVIAIVAVVMTVRWAKDAFDPEQQWPRLEKVLPFEERPAHLEMAMGTPIPFIMDQYVLVNHQGGYIATIMNFKSATVDELDQMFEESSQGAPFGLGAPADPELSSLEIQGEVTRCLRYSGLKIVGDQQGPGIRVDISGPRDRVMIVDLRRLEGDEAFSDADVEGFFEDFDVWYKR